MSKRIKITFIIIFILITSIVSYKLSYLLAEKYFFDRLFYKKSVTHGYLDCKKGCELEKFGRRTEDIQTIFGKSLKQESRVLGESADDVYTIALIGDSITWGVGIKEDDIVSALLEKKLSKIKKTKVLQLGFPGDDLLDNYIKYKLIQQEYPIDLYIFIIVENDLLFKREGNYDKEIRRKIISDCTVYNDLITYDFNEEAPGYNYKELVGNSFNNPQNLCVLEKTIPLYPKNSIFLVPQWWYDDYMDIYTQSLKKEDFKMVFMLDTKNNEKYRDYWQDQGRLFIVSDSETHPSKIAHKIYADILFEEIISKPEWQF